MKLKLFLISFLCVGFSFAQVSFETKLNKSVLGINESISVDFVMNVDGDNFSPPSFEDFTIVNGPNQSVSTTWLAGKRTFKKTYSYVLKPKTKGSFAIGQATIVFEDEIYKTKEVSVKISKKVKIIDINESVLDSLLYLKTEYSKNKISIDDSLTITHKLFVSSKISVDKIRYIDDIEIKNALINDMTSDSLEIKNVIINNQKFRSVIIKKMVVKPLKKGKLKISPIEIEISAGIPTGEKDVFERKIYREKRKVYTTEKVIIDVN